MTLIIREASDLRTTRFSLGGGGEAILNNVRHGIETELNKEQAIEQEISAMHVKDGYKISLKATISETVGSSSSTIVSILGDDVIESDDGEYETVQETQDVPEPITSFQRRNYPSSQMDRTVRPHWQVESWFTEQV